MKKILAFVLLSLLVFSSCDKAKNETDTQDITTDIETMSDRELVDWATVIKYNGAMYISGYMPAPGIGAKLGVVEYNIPEYYDKKQDIPVGSISATFTPVGEKIYECPGFSPNFRICAMAEGFDGFVIFERSNTLNGGEVPNFRETIPNSSKIKKLTYCDSKENVLCEIENKKYYIDTLWTCFEQSQYVPYEDYRSRTKTNRIIIEYTDGSTSYITIYEGGYANFVDYIQIPEEFFELIEDVMAGKSIAGRYEIVDWGDVIRYNGAIYWNIYSDVAPVADGLLGKVEYGIIEFYEKGEEAPADGISATFTDVGMNVYACKGYSPDFRICARGNSSFNIYERSGADGAVFSDLLPEADQIGKIEIEKASIDTAENELRVIIENREHIDELYSQLLKSEFVKGMSGEPLNTYRITLEFADGTKTEFTAYDNGYGYFTDIIGIPKEFFDLLKSYIE